MLAVRAEKGGASALAERTDGAAASRASLPGTAIDGTGQLETASATVALHIVAHAAAAGLYGFCQRGADGRCERMASSPAEAAGRAQRGYAGAEQAFRSIDVADTDDPVAVHKKGLYRRAAPAACGEYPVAVEFGRQRFDAEAGEQRMLGVGRRFVPEKRSEAARVAKAQHAVREDEVDVVVFLRRRVRRNEAQAAGHAQVQDEPAAAIGAGAGKEQVFAAPLDLFYTQSAQACW